jgi:hypothetical protein
MYFMFFLSTFQQHAGVVCEDILEVATNKLILSDTRVLGVLITAYWAKPRCANFVLEKYGYVNAHAFGAHTLCRVKYLHV